MYWQYNAPVLPGMSLLYKSNSDKIPNHAKHLVHVQYSADQSMAIFQYFEHYLVRCIFPLVSFPPQINAALAYLISTEPSPSPFSLAGQQLSTDEDALAIERNLYFTIFRSER